VKKHTIHQVQVKSEEVFRLEGVDVEFDSYRDGETVRQTFELLKKKEACAILLYEEDTDSLILVEQFRPATLKSGDGYFLEIIAGGIDDGEDPLAAAIREAKEEAGYDISSAEEICSFYVSPGITDEILHVYFAVVNSADQKSDGGGLSHENEDIKIVKLKAADIHEYLFPTQDAKSIIALQWFVNRDR